MLTGGDWHKSKKSGQIFGSVNISQVKAFGYLLIDSASCLTLELGVLEKKGIATAITIAITIMKIIKDIKPCLNMKDNSIKVESKKKRQLFLSSNTDCFTKLSKSCRHRYAVIAR